MTGTYIGLVCAALIILIGLLSVEQALKNLTAAIRESFGKSNVLDSKEYKDFVDSPRRVKEFNLRQGSAVGGESRQNNVPPEESSAAHREQLSE